jgi:hypothetical protein
MRFLPRSVMVGFVNALAIVIFMAQIPELIDVPAIVYPMVALGLAILVFMPKLTTVVPAPLVVIVLLTIVAVAIGLDLPTVGDKGELPRQPAVVVHPRRSVHLDTLQIIAPYAFAMALVGLLESLMTAKLVDDITDTHSDKTREGWGQGVANIVTGFFGGMGGCAMIGQTMINVKTSRGPHPDLDLRRRRVPAGARRRPRRRRRPHPDGRAGRGDDHGVGRHDGLAQRQSPHAARHALSATTIMVTTVLVTVSPPTTSPTA